MQEKFIIILMLLVYSDKIFLFFSDNQISCMDSFIAHWNDIYIKKTFFHKIFNILSWAFVLLDFEFFLICISFKFSSLKKMSYKNLTIIWKYAVCFSKKVFYVFYMFKSKKTERQIKRIIFKWKFSFQIYYQLFCLFWIFF